MVRHDVTWNMLKTLPQLISPRNMTLGLPQSQAEIHCNLDAAWMDWRIEKFYYINKHSQIWSLQAVCIILIWYTSYSMELLNKCVTFCSCCDSCIINDTSFTKTCPHVSYSAWSSMTDVAVHHQCLPIHSILLAVQYVLHSSHPHREHEPGLQGWLAGCHIFAHAERCKLACPAPVTHPSVRTNM